MIRFSIQTSALSGFRRHLRVLLLCVFASCVAYFLTHFSALSRIEAVLADQVSFNQRVAPSDKTVLVVVDEATVRQFGKYPYDREVLARTLDILNTAGANRIYLDAGLNLPEEPESDDALENALKRLGSARIGLPASRIGNSESGAITTRPLQRFARHASLVTTDMLYDSDRRVRRVAGLAREGIPLAGDWLNGESGIVRPSPLTIDFTIEPSKLQRFGMLDVVEGRIDGTTFKDRNVIVGLQLSTPQFIIAVPMYQQLSRVEVMALALETIQAGREVVYMPKSAVFGLTLAIALLSTAFILRLGSVLGFGFVCLVFVSWSISIEMFQRMIGMVFPVIGPPLAVLVLWQALKFKNSKLGHFISSQQTRLVGIGKNALVAAVEVVVDPAAVFDTKGTLLGSNEAFRNLSRINSGNVKAATLKSLFDAGEKLLLESASHDTQSRIDVSASHMNDTRHYEVSVRWIETITGKLAIASFKDVTASRKRESELSTLAFKDPLTGLANRMAFHARLHILGEHVKESPFGILMIDLDGFKAVNDTMGHHAGDLLLAGVALRIEALLQKGDMAARLGGDEFAILVASGKEADCVEMAAQFLAALKEPFDIEGNHARVGASIGIAMCPDHDPEAIETMKLADAAMYVAKRNKPAYAIHSEAGTTAIRSIAA